MDLDDIKRGLRAEIKKRENEQYATFQCNVRQMCKDVLDKLEEQESEIADLKKERDWLAKDRAQAYDDLEKRAQLNIKQDEAIRHHKYQRCLAVVRQCKRNRLHACVCGPVDKIDFWNKWQKRWLKLAEQFKEAK